jgi:hypothetical protein
MAHTLAYDARIVGDAAVPTEQAAAVTVPALCIASTATPEWLRGGAMAVAEALPEGQSDSWTASSIRRVPISWCRS